MHMAKQLIGRMAERRCDGRRWAKTNLTMHLSARLTEEVKLGDERDERETKESRKE